MTRFAIAILALCLPCAAALGQETRTHSSLTLHDAVMLAIDKSPLRKVAVADTDLASANVHASRSFILPHLSFTENATRGNDPVYVFGSKLRQQRFNEADFALNNLNTPGPFGNFSTRLGGTWSLFDSFASWHEISRAKFEKDAARHQLNRTEQELIFRVIAFYYQTLRANKQLEVSEQAFKTANGIAERSQARFDSGLVVQSDLLAAGVRLAERQQEKIRAKNDCYLAQAQLNITMGEPVESSFLLDEGITEHTLPTTVLGDIEARAIVSRPDLKRVASEEASQRESVSVAKSSFGPRVSAFAGWEADHPTLLAGGGGNNWLGGIEVKLDIFDGGSKRAELSRQRALAEKVAATKQAASDEVRLEVRRAYYDVDASRQQLETARATIAQANENLRINQDRYEAGLSTITDLLGAEETARRSQTDYWEAFYRFYTSYASLELASGTLSPQSPVVTQ